MFLVFFWSLQTSLHYKKYHMITSQASQLPTLPPQCFFVCLMDHFPGLSLTPHMGGVAVYHGLGAVDRLASSREGIGTDKKALEIWNQGPQRAGAGSLGSSAANLKGLGAGT